LWNNVRISAEDEEPGELEGMSARITEPYAGPTDVNFTATLHETLTVPNFKWWITESGVVLAFAAVSLVAFLVVLADCGGVVACMCVSIPVCVVMFAVGCLMFFAMSAGLVPTHCDGARTVFRPLCHVVAALVR